MQSLGVLPGFNTSSATAMSASGAVVIGRSTHFFGPEHAASEWASFRWTTNMGMERMPALPWSSLFFEANVVNGDGSVIAGTYDAVDRSRGIAGGAFAWTGSPGAPVTSGTYQQLPAPGVGGAHAHVNGINDAGTVIVGTSTMFSSYDWHPVEWVRDSSSGEWAPRVLPNMEDGGAFTPLAASLNGSVVGGCGEGHSWFQATAAIWTERYGAVDLNQVLPRLGISLNGFYLYDVSWVSPDGTQIGGRGFGPGGATGWTISGLDMAYIPAPSAVAPASWAVVVFSRRRRRGSLV
jgi:uncharacterized membrane protein